MGYMKKVTDSMVILFIIFCIGILVSYFYVPIKTVIYNEEYDIYATELDFTEKRIGDFNELVDKMGYFSNLQTVKFKDGTISLYQKSTLQKLYPTVNFRTISYINLYNKEIREDATEIDLTNMIIDSGILEKLQDFKELKEVNLYNQDLPLDTKVALVNRYPNITFKWKVILNGAEYDYQTENIDLSGSYIDNKEEFIKSLKLLENLKTLDMSNTNFSNEELGKMREMYPNVQIDWIVTLGRWHIKTSDTSFSVLIRAFDFEPLVSEDLHVLKYCTKLEALDLGHQHITDISMIPEYLPNLKVLILADNKITDISPLAKLDKLVYLELFINKITDLSPLEHLDNLVDLNLCYNNQLYDLSPIMNLPKLERVWLVNVHAPHEQIEELKNKHPNATIMTLGPGSTESGWRTHERYYAMIKMYRNPTWPVNEVFTKYLN